MRSLVIALVVTLLAAEPAAADYRRLPGPPPDDDLVLAHGAVLVGAGSAVSHHRPDGTVLAVPIPGGARLVEEVNASSTAATIIAIHGSGGSSAFYGPLAGPFRRFARGWIDVAVSGSRAVVLHRDADDRGGEMRVVDVRTGRTRRFHITGGQPRVIAASGRYVAYVASFASREAISVRSLTTGREVYRVRTRRMITYRLAPGGRLVVLISEADASNQARVVVATPGRPRLRQIRRIGLGSFDIAVTRDGIALARGDARARTEVALLGWDGRLRPITPLLPRVGAIAFDGRTVAFSVGNCVFTGPAELSPVATDGCVPSSDGGPGR